MYTVQHKPDQTGEIFLDTNKKVISYCGTQFYDFFFDGFVYNYPSMLVRESVKLLYYQIHRGSGKSSFKFIVVQGHLLL